MRRLSVVVIAVVACSKQSEEPQPKPAEQPAEPAKPTKPPLTAEWLGKAVGPPGELAKLKLGVPVAEAVKLVRIADSPSLEPSEVDDVSYGFDKDTKKILRGVMIEMPSARKAVLEQAWGPGQVADRGGSPVTVWFNPDTGIRASYSDERDGRAYVRFEPYVPLAKLLGDGPQVAALAKPFVGQTPTQLQTTYPEYWDGEGHFQLTPTEWVFGGFITLTPYPGDDKPTETFIFSIPYNEKGKGRAEIMELVEKKWGKSKGKVEFGQGAEIYNKKNPRIEVAGPDGYHHDQVTITVGQ